MHGMKSTKGMRRLLRLKLDESEITHEGIWLEMTIVLVLLVIIQGIIIVYQYNQEKRHDISLSDLAEKAAELSAKTHVSYDVAMQTLINVLRQVPSHRLRK
jgi:uncharacterized protein YbjQ (UPF0145 family)